MSVTAQFWTPNGIVSTRAARLLAVLALIVAAFALGIASPARAAATYTVTTADDHDDGTCNAADCSLREAINAANANSGPDTIAFDIPGAGVQTITLSDAFVGGLPPITDPVIIDGLTQPGTSCATWPPTLLIEINGSAAGSGASGLTLTTYGGGSTIRGLVINRFGANGLPYENGLNLDDSDDNTIQCNFIGTDTTGALDLGNGDGGIAVFYSSDDNLIGGSGVGERNLIAGNDGHGIDMAYDSTDNVVQGNYIGVNAAGNANLGNGGNGVLINFGSTHNTIGGDTPGTGNVISGNDNNGVVMNYDSSDNVVQGNFIGTDATGTVDLGNELNGILIVDASDNTIGGPTSAHRNLISGNGSIPDSDRNGVFIVGESASDNLVQNNYIGTDVTGTAALGNTRSGVAIIYDAHDNIVKDNVISANTESGVYIQFGSAMDNVVQGNLIGTDKNGTAALGNGYNGVTLDEASGNTIGGIDEDEGNIIAFNTGSGVLVTAGVGSANKNAIRGNSIRDNTGLGIDLGGDGVTLNDLDDADSGFNKLQNFPALLTVVPGASSTTLFGRLNSTPGTLFKIDFYDNETCDPSSNGEGQTYVGSIGGPTIITDGNGDLFFTTTLPIVMTENHPLTATATDPNGNTSEFSGCTLTGPDNTAWPNALRLDLLTTNTATKDQFIGKVGEPRWYKFEVKAGDLLNITLTDLPANYDLTVYKDIQKEFDELLNETNDLETQGAEFADAAFSPDRFSPDRFSPDRFSPEAYAAENFSPDRFSSEVYSPDRFSAETFAPDRFSQDAYAPDRFSPDRFSPDRFSPDRFSPDRFSTDPTAYENAQMRALVAVSAFNGTASEGIAVNTWLNAGDYYVRVVGRNGAFDPNNAFHLTLNRTPSACSSLNPGALPAGDLPAQPNGPFDTVILIDSTRMTIAGALTQRLTQLAGLTNGAVVDVSADARVAAANVLANNNKPCPFAKNLVAEAIKRIVDLYRGPTLQYVVIVGGDSVIPFFRQPDQSLLAPESQYAPPVRNDTASQAALKLNFVLTQDFYGAQTFISFDSQSLPVPDLAVGRLVETPTEIIGMIDAFVETNGVITPTTPSLVTGYDFLSDAATAVLGQLNDGTGIQSSKLIADPTLSPYATAITNPGTPPEDLPWNATQLSNALLGSRHDLVFLAGHFSANSALAADYTTRLKTADVLASTANLKNSLIYSAGCHSGYNIVDEDRVSAISEPYEIDWAQTLARKQAALVAGTGYQYGDDEFLEYSERLYLEFTKLLRTDLDNVTGNNNDVPIGQALTQAKQIYLAGTPQMKGIHAKAYLEATLWGLPMMKVRMTGALLTSSTESSIITATESASNQTNDPADQLGLQKADVTLNNAPSAPQTKTLTLPDGTAPLITTFFSGPNGVVSNQVEPLLPLSTFNVTGPGGLALRGVGFRGGTFTDYPGVIPLTGSVTTELRGVRGLFTSNAFYPVRPWKTNYYDAIANGGGATRLNLLGAQYMSDSANSNTGTMRVYSDMNFRLYYSANVSDAGAKAAPPAIVRVFAESSGGDLNFSAVVVGDPTAGVQEVWVTYFDLNNLAAGWQSVNLEQDPDDSTLWKKTLSFTNPASIRYIVQAVNGVGLVTLSDNLGAYYQADVDPGAPPPAPPPNQPPSALAFVSAPTSGNYGGSAAVIAKLTIGGNPVAGAEVSLKFGFQTKIVTTGSNGQASATFNLFESPGSYQFSAEFAGNETFAPAPTSTSTFTLNKQPTTLVLSPTSATVNVGQDSGLKATLSGTGGQLNSQAVVFVVSNGSNSATVPTITDISGVAKLGLVNLPPGTYTVTAHFGDNVIPGLDLTSPTYRLSTATGTLTIRAPFPANSVLDNFNRNNRDLNSGGKPWKGEVDDYRIVNNQVKVGEGGPIYWNNPAFGVNQEAFVTLTKVDGHAREQDLLLKVQSGPGNQPNWQKGAIEVLYDSRANGGAGAVRVETIRPGVYNWTVYANIPVKFNDGDQLGAQALSNGTVKIYKNGVLVGTVALNTADKNFFQNKGGKIGLWFIKAKDAVFDDFGGGTFTP